MQANWIVLVQNNCPFVDPILVDRLVAAAWATPTSDLISFVSSARPDGFNAWDWGWSPKFADDEPCVDWLVGVDANDQRDVSQLIQSMS